MHVIVEGIVCSGKTTFIKEYYSHLDRVPELAESNIIMPEFSLNEDKILSSNLRLVNLDLRRFREIKETSVFDRWLFSTFAYAYARNKIYGIKDGNQLRALADGINLNFYLKIMETPFDLCMKRLILRKETDIIKYQACTKKPYSKRFYHAMNEYFTKIRNIKTVDLSDYILH